MLHQPAGKMYIDFAGDRMSYVDMETGEVVPVETFAAVLPAPVTPLLPVFRRKA